MNPPGCQRFKMWQTMYAPLFKGKVHMYTYRLFIMNNRIAICLFQMESKCAKHSKNTESRVLNILAQLTEKSTELTEQCSVEQHDVSALNGE